MMIGLTKCIGLGPGSREVMITLWKQRTYDRNDSSRRYYVNEVYFDIDAWEIICVKGSSNRKGTSLSERKSVVRPETFGITKNTPLNQVDLHEQDNNGFALRIYYSQLKTIVKMVYPGGYILSDLPSMPYKDCPLYINECGAELLGSIFRSLNIENRQELMEELNRYGFVPHSLDYSDGDSTRSLQIAKDVEVAQKYDFLELTSYR